MLKALLKYSSQVILITLLASATVFAVFHQTMWRYEPISFSQIRQSVHKIDNLMGSCSGVMIAPKRMLTAAHCEGPELNVEDKAAKVIAQSDQDSILLEVDIDCPCVPVGSSIVTGDPVYIVGYPLGATRIMVMGHFEGVMDYDRFTDFKDYLIFAANVEGGFSGGGVFQFRPDVGWTLISTVSAGSKTILLAPKDLAREEKVNCK